MISGCVEDLKEILSKEEDQSLVYLNNITNLSKMPSEILSYLPSSMLISLSLGSETIVSLLILSFNILKIWPEESPSKKELLKIKPLYSDKLRSMTCKLLIATILK